MKRMILLLLAMVFALSLCACAATPEEVTEPAIVETEAPAEVEQETIPEDLIDEEEFRLLTNYYVTVLDENAAPVVGAMVQLDAEEAVPCATDDTGVAVFALEAGTYTATILELPYGYEIPSEEQIYVFAEGEVTLAIQVQQIFAEPNDEVFLDEEIFDEEPPVEEIVPEG